nr:MAG TPA: hypothetical protein [Caudoviricetes sp.]
MYLRVHPLVRLELLEIVIMLKVELIRSQAVQIVWKGSSTRER